jgi:hypothetical protein
MTRIKVWKLIFLKGNKCFLKSFQIENFSILLPVKHTEIQYLARAFFRENQKLQFHQAFLLPGQRK